MPSLIDILKKVTNDSVNDIVVDTLKELVLGWGGRSYYRSNTEEKDRETYLQFWDKRLNEENDDDNDEYGEYDDDDGEEKKENLKRKVAPKEMQEQLKKVVLKSRSPIERENAIQKLDDTFLEEQIKNPKQMMRVRLYAIQFAPQKLIDDLVENSKEDEIRKKAVSRCQNEKSILKYVNETKNYEYFWKLPVKAIIDNFPENFDFSMIGSFFKGFVDKLKNPKDINFVLDKVFSVGGAVQPLHDERHYFLSELPSLLKKVDDKKLMKNTFTWVLNRYGSNIGSEVLAFVILNLKDDKAFIKKILEENIDKLENSVSGLVLDILDDEKIYKEIVIDKISKKISKKKKDDDYDDDDEGQTEKVGKKTFISFSYYDLVPYCLAKIKDEKFVKDTITRFNLMVPTIVTKIKDEDFLKKYFKETEDEYALTNIQDNSFLKETALKTPKNIKFVKDEAYLKKTYEKLVGEEQKAKEQKAKEQRGYRSNYDRDAAAELRAATLNNIKDQEFIINVAKQDPSFIVRKAAIKNITDVATVEKFLLRETSKQGKQEIIDVISNQDILMRFIKKQKDHEVKEFAYPKLNIDSIIKLVTEGEAVPSTYVRKMDIKVLQKLMEKNETTAERYIGLVTKDQDFLLKILKKYKDLASDVANQIDSENAIKKLITDDDFLGSFDNFKKITDPDLMEYILLNKKNLGTKDTIDLLVELNPSQEFMVKLLENSNTDVAKATVNFITDISFLISVMSKSENDELIEYIYKKIWPNIKGDPEAIKKLTDTKSLFLIEKIIPLFDKQDEFLIKLVRNLKSSPSWRKQDLIVKAISLLSDSKKIKGMIPSLGTDQIKKIDPEIVKDWLITTTDKNLDFCHVSEIIRDLKIKPLELYVTAKADTVKSASLLMVDKKNFPQTITKDIVKHFVDGVQKTERPHSLDKKVIKLIYDNAEDKEQDLLANYLDSKDLNERHRDALHRPYLVPKKSNKTITPLEHGVEKNPLNQLFRLLVHIAR